MTNQLWKSAKKVGGTAVKVFSFLVSIAVEICQKGGWNSSHQEACNGSCAVEICQKGGWNSGGKLKNVGNQAVEICQKGGWNSFFFPILFFPFAVEICQKGGWNSDVVVNLLPILCCGNLPKRWVEQPFH